MNARLNVFWVSFCVLLFLTFVDGEPVQFCKSDSEATAGAAADFCIALSTYKNTSSLSQDFYITIAHRRRNGSPLSWTALGLGTEMAGAIMFIIYGDPQSHQPPVVSVRTSTGHHQPTLLNYAIPNGNGGVEIHVVSSSWRRSGEITSVSEPPLVEVPSFVATISLVCYSCPLWPNTSILSTSQSQPWIWAFNPSDDIAPFPLNANLSMHSHDANGYGNFYLDMPRSLSPNPLPPRFPPIVSQTAATGASEYLNSSGLGGLNSNQRGQLWRLHGLLLSTAFLLIFPIGVIAIRSGSSKSFGYHWILQTIASILAILGILLGVTLSRKLDLVHQYLGIAVAVLLVVQSAIGYRHHVSFVRLRRRSWFSDAHVYLGRIVVSIAWVNIVLGMLLKGHSMFVVAATAIVIAAEAIGLTLWLRVRSKRAARQRLTDERSEPRRVPTRKVHGGDEECFALVGEGDDEEDGSSNSEDDGAKRTEEGVV